MSHFISPFYWLVIAYRSRFSSFLHQWMYVFQSLCIIFVCNGTGDFKHEMANRLQRLDIDLNNSYDIDLDWNLLPDGLKKICSLFGKAMKQRPTTVLLGMITMISYCLGHASIFVKDYWSEPIILWLAIVLPTGRCKSTFHQFITDVMLKVERKAAREGNEVKQVFLPHCTWDKFGDILANSGARSFGLFDELVSFFSTMNMYNTTKMQVSDTKEYQDFLQMFTGKTKTRETITGNANYKMTQTSFTLMGFTQPQTALPIIQDDQNNAKGFTSRLLWFFPEPVFCKLQDTILDEAESGQLKQFTNKLIKFLAGLYTEGEKSYTIEGGERVTTVTVCRQKFKLSEEAHRQFESIHDEWELTICKKYPHDAFVGGLYSRGKSHILRLAVTIQLLLSFWNDMESQSPDSEDNAKHSGEVHHDGEHQSGSDDAEGSDDAHNSDNAYDSDDTLGSENEGFDACQFVGSDAVNIASSIVSTCLAQLCTLNEKMHVIRQLDGDNEQTMESSPQAGGSTNISVFGRLYSTILLTHGEVVSLSILNQRGIFRKPCNNLHAKNLMLKVLDDMTALGLGKIESFQIPGNRFQVYFFKKSPVPDDHDKLKIFIQMLAKCGVSLPSYTTSLTAQDEERKKHQEDYENRQDPNYNSPTKKRKL